MKIRKITKFEVCGDADPENVHDIEFVPSDKRGMYEVWVNGVLVEELGLGEKPSAARACYYYELHCLTEPSSEEAPVRADGDLSVSSMAPAH